MPGAPKDSVTCRQRVGKQPTQLPTQIALLGNRRCVYCGHGKRRDHADRFRPPAGKRQSHSVQHTDFDVRGLGRRFPQTDAPEGWVKKMNAT